MRISENKTNKSQQKNTRSQYIKDANKGTYSNKKSPQANRITQLQELANNHITTKNIQRKANNTGLPDQLKTGIENLSGMSMNDVKVHYNSPKPAQLQAHAYAQGTQIHVAPGQEKHLPHEAWHVVQQKQGRVKPTKQLKTKVAVNDDPQLEKEADVMGAKALHHTTSQPIQSKAIQENSVLQLFPSDATGKWKDIKINETEYDTFLALATANIKTYEKYDPAHLKQLFVLFKKYLTPAQLQGLIGEEFKTTVTNVNTRLNVRTIKLPGVKQTTVNDNIKNANDILSRYNITVHVAAHVDITKEQLGLGLPSLDKDGKLPKDRKKEDNWDLIGRFIGSDLLPILWVPDFTGHSWRSKPSGITSHMTDGIDERIMVFMRPGQTGVTLAHEMGHAMGGTLGDIQHGQHVNDFNKLNLMHGDPIIESIHKNLAREQIAAFKGSRFVTLV